MARSGGLRVIEFACANNAGRITVANTGIDISVTGADAATLAVPTDLIIYQFGVYVMEDMLAAATGSIFLERATNIVGSDTTIAEMDLDTTDLKSGDGVLANQTASTGSEDIDAGDVIFSPASLFPYRVLAPVVLTVRWVQSSNITGELAPFIVCKWLPPDLRPDTQWSL